MKANFVEILNFWEFTTKNTEFSQSSLSAEIRTQSTCPQSEVFNSECGTLFVQNSHFSPFISCFSAYELLSL
jgi:hypothetical protein